MRVFYRKPLRDGAQALMVRGFTDDSGRERAEHLINVVHGSSHSGSIGSINRLAELLNEAWDKWYEGDN